MRRLRRLLAGRRRAEENPRRDGRSCPGQGSACGQQGAVLGGGPPLYLPVADQFASVVEILSSTASRFRALLVSRMKRLRILLLEDDLLTSLAMGRALETQLPDCIVMRAQSLYEARLMLRTYDFGLFIMDV